MHLGVPVEQKSSLGMKLVLIPPGEFSMGSTPKQVEAALMLLKTVPRAAPGEADRIQNEEQPQHRVVLTRPVRLGRTEVTVGEFRQFVEAAKYVTETERFGGGNSSKIAETDPVKQKALWSSPGYKVTDESPVTQLTWNDMVAFCNWLSKQEQRDCCYELSEQKVCTRVANANGYRLPTEAEWEFACRAGTTTQYSFGDNVTELDEYAWFNRTAEKSGQEIGARPVASKRPNPFGLFDMHGNAWERCQDYHAADWSGERRPCQPAHEPPGNYAAISNTIAGSVAKPTAEAKLLRVSHCKHMSLPEPIDRQGFSGGRPDRRSEEHKNPRWNGDSTPLDGWEEIVRRDWQRLTSRPEFNIAPSERLTTVQKLFPPG